MQGVQVSHQVCYYLSSQSLSEMMQLGISAISATWSHVINYKDVSKPEVKPCKHKYY